MSGNDDSRAARMAVIMSSGERMIREAHGQGLGSATFVDQTTRVMGLNVLCDEALRIAREHGFNEASVGEEIALMHSELSEALEDFRAGHAPTESWYLDKKSGQIVTGQPCTPTTSSGQPHPDFKPCGIPSEMADVVIHVLHFCGKHAIDLDKAVKEKMAFNESRPFKHGKVL